MKILLINPPVREWARPNCFPLGLGYIASVLLNENHDVQVMDINAYRWSNEEVENRIRNTEFNIAGITGIITTYKYVKWLTDILKKHHPDSTTIVGGSVGSSIPELILKKNKVDIVCIGEGEETIREVVRAIENKRDISTIRGIWYKDGKGNIFENPKRNPINVLDSIPWPAWDLFPIDIYLKNPVGAPNRNKWIDGSSRTSILSMNMSGVRGCPYRCIFCYHDFMGQGYRLRSVDNIIKEVEYLYKRYGITYFHFTDDEFIIKKSFVYEFCKAFKSFSRRENIKFTWGCGGRVNLMTEDLIATMADAGCILIGYGIESGSQKMLDFIKKQVTVDQAKNAIKLTKKYLGWADCSLMVGYPGETRDTIQETIDFCKEVELIPEVIFFLTPYPGTELYSMALNEERIKDEEEYLLGLGEQGEKVRVNFTEFSDKELFDMHKYMIKELKAWNKMKHPEAR